MNDIVDRVWRSYHLPTVQVDHPLRLLCEFARRQKAEADEAREGGQAAARALADALGEVNRLGDELEQMRALAQANGEQRDAYCREYLAACRERDRLAARRTEELGELKAVRDLYRDAAHTAVGELKAARNELRTHTRTCAPTATAADPPPGQPIWLHYPDGIVVRGTYAGGKWWNAFDELVERPQAWSDGLLPPRLSPTPSIDQQLDEFAAGVREIECLIDAGLAAQAREHDGPGGLVRWPHDDMGTPTEDQG